MNLEDFGLIPHHCKTVPPGTRFGRLVVIAIGKPPISYRYKAICQCDCGSDPIVVRLDGLTSGAQVSCKCYWREIKRTHGLTKHPLYNTWKNMMSRCYNPDDQSYSRYGGRGVAVCSRWHDIRNFVTDMEASYSPGLEIDRIDNDGNYESSNCHWANKSQQADNRRTGRKITFKGKTQSLLQWSKETGINYGTLWTRIAVWKWSPERALTTSALSAKERMRIARDIRWNR